MARGPKGVYSLKLTSDQCLQLHLAYAYLRHMVGRPVDDLMEFMGRVPDPEDNLVKSRGKGEKSERFGSVTLQVFADQAIPVASFLEYTGHLPFGSSSDVFYRRCADIRKIPLLSVMGNL